jgi:carbon-monoxide dehydrogenase medium subunit
MLLNTFEYLKPKGLAEVLRVLDELKQTKTQVMAGGTDLIPALRDRSKQPEYVVDLSEARLDDVVFEPHQARIGALTTFARLCRDVEIWEKLPAVAEAAVQVGAVQCRNLATIGGNVCSAVPSLDSAPPLLALGAKFRLQAQGRERTVPAEEFFLGPRKTVLEQGEILTEILVPLEEGFHASFMRQGRRKALTLSIVNAAAGMAGAPGGEIARARIALGAVAPTPIRARKAEALLVGRKPTAELLAEAAAVAVTETSPISDLRASADYRRQLTAVLVRRALEKALARMHGERSDARVAAMGGR